MSVDSLKQKALESTLTSIKDTDGVKKVNDAVSGVVSVSGTVAATQSGTWDVATLTNPVSGVVSVSGTVAATQSGAYTATVAQGGAWTATVAQGGAWTATVAQGGAWTATVGNALSGVVSTSGTVDVDGTVAVTGNVSVSGTVVTSNLVRTEDTVAVAFGTDKIMNGTTEITPKYKVIAATASGDNTLVSAITDTKIRVFQFGYVCSEDVTVRFESGAGGTALTGQMPHAQYSGMNSGFNPLGHFEAASATLLNMELSATATVAGYLVYGEI